MPPLAAALEECLEALSILQNNQGRSQAAPLAASGQRTRCRDRTQPQRTSRMLRAPYILEKEQQASPMPLPLASLLIPPSHKRLYFMKFLHFNYENVIINPSKCAFLPTEMRIFLVSM